MSKYESIKRKFVIGIICFVVGIAFAVGGHLHAQELDLANLLYYETTDVRVYAFAISTVGGFVLLGIPFIMLNLVKRIFAYIFYLITHNSAKLEFATNSGADSVIEVSKDENGNTVFGEEKSTFRVVCETVLGILLLIVGGLLLYTIGIVASLFVLIAQLIYLIVNKNKNREDDYID